MKKKNTASSLEQKFDRGEAVLGHFSLNKIRKPARTQQRVNVDFPLWMVGALDKEASRLGVTRQSLIKMWLADKLQYSPPAAR